MGVFEVWLPPKRAEAVETGDNWTDLRRMRVAQHDSVMQREKV